MCRADEDVPTGNRVRASSLLSCASKTVLGLKFITSRVLATLAQAPIQPTGQRRMLIFAPGLVRVGSAGGAMSCPHRGPRACLPMVQRGRCAGGCVSVPGVCSGHTALDRARPKGPAASHPPATPVFYLDLLFPPKTGSPSTWTWLKGFLLCNHVGHRRELQARACWAQCRHLGRRSRRPRWALLGRRDAHLRAAGAGLRMSHRRVGERGCGRGGVALAPHGPLLAPGCCGPASPLSEAAWGVTSLIGLPRAVLLARPGGARGAS